MQTYTGQRHASKDVRDFVLPVVNLDHDGEGRPVKDTAKLMGTCFLIGERGYALTAAHVLKQIDSKRARVMVRDSDGWEACLVTKGEIHPTEDVGILKIDLPRPVLSPVFFAQNEPLASAEYSMWAYPDEIANEIKYHPNAADRGGPGYLNRISASLSGAPAGVRLPSGLAVG